MTGHRATEPTQWQLPRGLVAYRCVAERCPQIATIAVSGVKGIEWPLCPDDWRDLHRRTRGLIQTMRMLDRPGCFRADCDDEAVTVIEHIDRTPIPACQRHWDDLSWVTPDDPACEALLDENGEFRRDR